MSTAKLQAFYKSRKWETLVKQLRIERARDTDGFVICEHCGQPIVKSYDCIGHHVIELTDDNVDDALISLNPDNIKLVHFRCHNEIHKRFGYNTGGNRQPQRVYIVYGAPCAGKTTWVAENADTNDIILDIDKLWGAIRSDKCEDNEKPAALTTNVFALRDHLLDMIRVRRGRWQNAYIIGGYALERERDRVAAQVGADKLIFIDTPKDVCIQRAAEKNVKWIEYVQNWFDLYTPPSEF